MYEWALLNAKRFDGDSCKTLLIDIYPAAAASILSEYSVTCNDQLMRDEIDTLLNDCEKALEILKCEVSIVENNKTCYNISEHPVSLSSLDGTSAFSSRDAHKFNRIRKIQCHSADYEGIRGSVDIPEESERYPVRSTRSFNNILDVENHFERTSLVETLSNDNVLSNMAGEKFAEMDVLNVDEFRYAGRSDSVSPAPTQYEIPITKDDDQRIYEVNDDGEKIRWRNYSWSPINNSVVPSISASFRQEEVSFFDDIGCAPVTLDLTDKIIASMSSKTLHKHLDQRRSSTSIPPPGPLSNNGWIRPGSARFALGSKSRPPLLRNLSSDFLDHRFPSSFGVCHSLDESKYSTVDTSRPESCVGSGPFKTDCSTQSEQICMIYDWLNPSKTSNANYRIECTVVRDLLDTEIEYVSALRRVVQDYLPELVRADIPSHLRGKKYCVFGNIERLFQFHAHNFLPQLISRLSYHEKSESLSLTIGKLFVDCLNFFNLYSLYAKNKPKSDQLLRDYANDFSTIFHDLKDLSILLMRPVERIAKYTLVLQQLFNAAPLDKLNIIEILDSVVAEIGGQIRRGSDLLAMERITCCDLNLKEQGKLIRHDTLFVIEKHGLLHSKKRIRSSFLFEKCVVLTKPKLRKLSRGCTYDELKYKASIQMTDCGLTEMVKDSKVKFELWFRKQRNSITYILEAQSPTVRDAWIGHIRCILWKQAIHSREESNREKASMGDATYIHLGPNSYANVSDFDSTEGSRRPRSLISLSVSTCSSSNIFRMIGSHDVNLELDRVEESEELEFSNDLNNTVSYRRKIEGSTLPRHYAPPPPKI